MENIKTVSKNRFLVTIIDYFVHLNKSHIYVVADRCNDNLNDFMIQSQHEFDDVLGYMNDITAGLLFLKMKSVVHPNLKPRNVLVTYSRDQWVCKLGDVFQVSNNNQIKFDTALYMAPEVEDGSEPSCQSNVFSLGLVMCAMCTRCDIGGTLMPYIRTQNDNIDVKLALRREEALPYDYMHVKLRDLLCLMLIEEPETRVEMENVKETIGSMTKAGQTVAYDREDEFASV